MPYNDKLGATEQVDMEEKIAAMIFDFTPADALDLGICEEDAAALSKKILLAVLTKFRPDLVTP